MLSADNMDTQQLGRPGITIEGKIFISHTPFEFLRGGMEHFANPPPIFLFFRHIPLGGAHLENVYPCKTPTLSGTKYEKPYPYWHKFWAQIHTLTGTTPPPQKKSTLCIVVQKGFVGAIVGVSIIDLRSQLNN